MATNKNQKTVSQETIDKVGGKQNLRRLVLRDEFQDLELEVISRIPDRTTMGEYLKYANVNPKKAQEVLVNGCLLTDRDEVLGSDALFNSCVAGIAETIPMAAAKVEKY
ncbi:hypothetical protein F0358_05210 [Empedobacter brevis]|uniref:hypothetical protein n=1 Tax=Empedobacter brevis TaxID=247 RepID=UPI00123E26B7|nr:hypothetical protein [Empedobacter brevis]QES92158.1 hypothetical protein F0358_05210 [Empedobacter brevis]